MVFVSMSLEQVPEVVQVAVVPIMVETPAGIVPDELVSVVEVIEIFHPAAVPLRSLLINGIG